MDNADPQHHSATEPPREPPGVTSRAPGVTPFVPSVNCQTTARADRLAFLVDGAAYFRAFKQAALNAERSILIVGWEVNPFANLEFPDRADPDLPNALGPFLVHLLDRRPDLRVRVLVWQSPSFFEPGRELAPRLHFDWLAPPRMTLALDRAVSPGASHHQKLVVMDDALAFVGGIDLTVERLDTPEHRIDDPDKRLPNGRTYPPHHDIQAMLDGPAAAALAEVARSRWFRATGERLPALPDTARCWPDAVAPEARRVEVAIARTIPSRDGETVREIERLYLDAIAAARHSIYIENQFFTATRIVQALIDRAGESDGPEIVVILPRDRFSWLEKQALDALQSETVTRLREADAHGRVGVYCPVQGAPGGDAIKVHAKAMIVDGVYVQVGSANLANRSMGLDSECDIAACLPSAAALRDRLLAEHLGRGVSEVADRIAEEGSIKAAIEALKGPGRSLVAYPVPADFDRQVNETAASLLDPSQPLSFEGFSDEVLAQDKASARAHGRTVVRATVQLVAILAGLAGLAALWRWGPLAQVADVASVIDHVSMLRGEPAVIAAVLAIFLLGSLAMFPLIAMLVATGLLLGPWVGMAVAAVGSLGGALLGYWAGAALGAKPFERFAGARLERLSQRLARRGILSVALLRLMPVAPFTLVNMIAGASHIRLRDFMLGSALGMTPAVIATTLLGGQLGAVLRSPGWGGLLTLTAIAVAVAVAGALLFRWSARWQRAD